MLTLIKAMSFQNLGYDERTRYVEALYTLAAEPSYGRSYTVAASSCALSSDRVGSHAPALHA
ncbi:hypothetical protein [Stenotrophomonas muris]|uniref:hypothetical protein n=1 Tax=Stenotrophomonas muris TaxID=2963283 RepID=UPI002E7A1562|nr:hypothetical protein [Stenotrophomonas muris]